MTNNPQRQQEYDAVLGDNNLSLYSNLRDLLAAGKWKEGDEETKLVILTVAKREQEGWLDTNSINNFPSEDLRTIDQLWVKYSNGKFGFSVQKKIYQGFEGNGFYDFAYWHRFWNKFVQEVGWDQKIGVCRLDKESGKIYIENLIEDDLTAPEGHLPRLVMTRCNVRWCGAVYAIMARQDL